MFLYSSESWVPEEYFKLLQTLKHFHNTKDMSDWKIASDFGTFPVRRLRFVVGSSGMILTPMFLYSLESWEPEEYFKRWQSSKSFQNIRDMTIWKLTSILVILPHFLPSPIFCIYFVRPPPYVRKSAKRVLACTRYRSSCSSRLTDFLTSGGGLIILLDHISYLISNDNSPVTFRQINVSGRKLHYISTFSVEEGKS